MLESFLIFLLIALATNAFQCNSFDILLAKNWLVTTGKCFQIQVPEAANRSCCVKKVFLKTSQYSQENTCVESSFNKVAGLNETQVFFCEYCNIFSNNLFYRPPSRGATKGGGGGGGGGLCCPFLKIIKSALILEKKALIVSIFRLNSPFKM